MYFIKPVVLPLMAIDLVLGVSLCFLRYDLSQSKIENFRTDKLSITQVPTQTITLQAPLSNYTVVDIEWNVQVNSSIPSIAINGTVQDVLAHLAVIHPEYVTTVEKNIAERKLGEAAAAAIRDRATDFIPQGIDY